MLSAKFFNRVDLGWMDCMATLAMGQSLKRRCLNSAIRGPLPQGHDPTRRTAQGPGSVEALAERQAVFFLAATLVAFFAFTLRATGCLAEVSVMW
jgi:hypothetical protein